MITITRWPAIILANYRTGSSPLTYKLSLDNNVPCFVEPSITEERTVLFLNHLKTSNPFLVKFMPDQIQGFEPYRQLLETDCFKIKLKRNNKVEQIASYYLALVRDKWWTTEQEEDKDYFIPVFDDKIEYSIKKITEVDSMLDSYHTDYELSFEDFSFIEGIDRKHSHKPKNIERLYELIKGKL